MKIQNKLLVIFIFCTMSVSLYTLPSKSIETPRGLERLVEIKLQEINKEVGSSRQVSPRVLASLNQLLVSLGEQGVGIKGQYEQLMRKLAALDSEEPVTKGSLLDPSQREEVEA